MADSDWSNLDRKLTARGKESELVRERREREAREKARKAEDAKLLAESIREFEEEDDDDTLSNRFSHRNRNSSQSHNYHANQLHNNQREAPSRYGRSHGPTSTVEGQIARQTAFPALVATVNKKLGPRPSRTIQLISLPPTYSEADVRKLLPNTMQQQVEAVNIDFVGIPRNAKQYGRKSMSATAVISSDFPLKDLEEAVHELDKKYLGCGYFLNCVQGPPFSQRERAPDAPASNKIHHPFGAVEHTLPNGRKKLVVEVRQPSDITQLRMIHATIEAVLTNRTQGVLVEAVLMNRQDIQKDEAWAWLYDACSLGGVYYRWRMYELAAGPRPKRQPGEPPREYQLFSSGPVWLEPCTDLPAEFMTSFSDLLKQEHFNEELEEDPLDEDGEPVEMPYNQKHHAHGPEDGKLDALADDQFLGPIRKSHLVCLLASLPPNTKTLRVGDVAGITSFVASNSLYGPDEIVELLVDNVFHPLSLQEGTSIAHAPRDEPTNEAEMKAQFSEGIKVGMLVLADVIQGCHTSSHIRGIWRYRTLLAEAIVSKSLFEYLGHMEPELHSRLGAERFRNFILTTILGAWTASSIFQGDQRQQLEDQYLAAAEPHKKHETSKAKSEAAPTGRNSGNSWQAFLSGEGKPNVDSATSEPAVRAKSPKQQNSGETDEKALTSIKDEAGDQEQEASKSPDTEGVRPNKRPRAADLFS